MGITSRVSDVVDGVQAARKLHRLQVFYMKGYNDATNGRQAALRPPDASDDEWLAYRAGRQDQFAGRRPRAGVNAK